MTRGLWVFICGPSGAGKDSVMAWAAAALADHPRIVFARRLVTRRPQPGGDHDEISPTAFARRVAAAGLAWHWTAHGHGYGIDAAYAADVAAGRVVVVNGSREHVGTLDRSGPARVVLVTADATRLAERLQRRGREARPAIAQRLARAAALPAPADLTITNDDQLAVAGEALECYLRGLAAAG